MTRKRKEGGIGRVEIEKRLTQEEYVALMVEADPAFRPVHKERYCLSENGFYYEIDIYPEWKEKAIMEIELHSEDQEIVFPEGMDVIPSILNPSYNNLPVLQARTGSTTGERRKRYPGFRLEKRIIFQKALIL